MSATTILHVDVHDNITGRLLTSVDAASTADGLAYYLRSRHLDDNASVINLYVRAEADVTPDVRSGAPSPSTGDGSGKTGSGQS